MSLQLPSIKSWIRVNPHNVHDLKKVLELVPDEEVSIVLESIENRKWAKEPRFVVVLFNDENGASVFGEAYFDAEILPTLEQVEEPTRVEVAIFEFDGDWEALGRWSSTAAPDATPYAFEGLKHGDLVMYRGGGFEIFNPRRDAETSEGSVDGRPSPDLKIQALSLAINTPFRTGEPPKTTIEIAQEFYNWLSES